MIEGVLFLSTLLVVSFLCWKILRADKAAAGKRPSLGLFAHKDDVES